MKKLFASMLGLLLTVGVSLAGQVHGLVDGATGREIMVLYYDGIKTQMVSAAQWYYSPSPGVTNVYVSVGSSNSVFLGAGTTGLVGSVVADAGKFLRADGTWQAVSVSGMTNIIGFWVGTNTGVNLQGGTGVTVRTVGNTNYLDVTLQAGLTNTIGSWVGTNTGFNLQGGTGVTVRTVGNTNYLDVGTISYALAAGYATVAGSATNSQNSGYATNAGFAVIAGSSTNANYASVAAIATNAQNLVGLTNTIGSWNGTNINLQGGTSVTVRTVGNTNYLDVPDADFAATWIRDTGVNGKLTTGSLITQTNLFVVDVAGGTGYINYGSTHKKLTWAGANTNTSTMLNGIWWVYVDPTGALKFNQTQPDIFQNITLGFFINSQFGTYMINNLNNTLIDQMGTRITQYLYSMGPFLVADAGNIVAKHTTNTAIQSSQCNVQSGLNIQTLPQRDSDISIQTNSMLWYKTADFGYLLWTNYNGSVPTWSWNNSASNWGSAFITLATNQYAKHLVARSLDGNFHVLMAQAVYTTKTDAVNGLLPDIPDSLSDTALMMATVVVRGGDTNFVNGDSSIYDIRPLPPHLSTRYGGGVRTTGASISHSLLMDLAHDDHIQYSLANGGRPFTGVVGYDSAKIFSAGNDIPDKSYVDTIATNAAVGNSNAFLQVSGANKMTGNLNGGLQKATNFTQVVLSPGGIVYPVSDTNYMLLQGGQSVFGGLWLYGTNATAPYAGAILAQLGHTNASLAVYDANTNNMLTVNRSGVGIGTNAPSGKLEVNSGAQTHMILSGVPTDYGVIRRGSYTGGLGLWGGDAWNTGAAIWLHGTNFTAQSPNMGAMQFTLAWDAADVAGNQAKYQFFDHTGGTLIYDMIGRTHEARWYDVNGNIKMFLTNTSVSAKGNVWLGIGTTAPATTLDVNGDATVRSNLTVNGGNLIVTNGTFTVDGQVKMSSVLTSVGNSAGSNGNFNVFIGQTAGSKNTASANTFVGDACGRDNISGGNNVAVGAGAMKVATNSGINVAVGVNALGALLNDPTGSGGNNVAVGESALRQATNAINNVAIGAQTLQMNNGRGNTAIGANALRGRLSGVMENGGSNVCVGLSAGLGVLGYENIMIGANAGYQSATHTNNANTVVGSGAASSMSLGNYNTMFGYQAGYLNNLGDSNVFIGAYAGYNETGSNKLYIANSSTTQPLIKGDFGTSNVWIGGNMTVSNFLFRTVNTNLLANSAVLTPVSDVHLVYGTGSVLNATNTITIANPTQAGQIIRLVVGSTSTNKIRLAVSSVLGLTRDWVGNTNDAITFLSTSTSQWVLQGEPQSSVWDSQLVLNNQNNTYTVGTTQNMSSATAGNLSVTGSFSLFGTNVAGMDTNLVLLADGTQPYTATQNGGGFGVTNLGALVPAGSNTVDLGSAAKPWRDLYLDTNSIYMGGQKVLSYNPVTSNLVTTVPIVQQTSPTNTNTVAYVKTTDLTNSSPITVNGQLTVIVTNLPAPQFGSGLGGIVLGGATNVDKNILFMDGTKKTFSLNTYRGENGKYLYLSDYEAGKDLMTASRSGRFGINKMNNLLGYHTLGSQPDKSSDLELDTTKTEYTPNYQLSYLITVDGTNAVADTYKIQTARDTVTYTTQSTGNVMSLASVNIGNGIWMYWTQVTNHTIGETRKFLGVPQLPRASFSVSPMFIDEVMVNTNLNGTAAWVDRTYEANTSQEGMFRPFRTGTNSAMYVGMTIPNNSYYINIATAGVGVVYIIEYWTGSSWTKASNWVENTANFTASGDITMDATTMDGWTTNNLTVDTYTNLYYWARFRSTNTVTTEPWVQSVTRHGANRFQVYEAPLDDTPTMKVDAAGNTWIGGLPMTPAIVQSFYYKFLAQCSIEATATVSSAAIAFNTEVSDPYNVYTNGTWSPNSTSLIRINWSIRAAGTVTAGRGWYVVLFENGTAIRDIDLAVSGDNADIPLANGTYIFAPGNATNTYQIGTRRFSANDVNLAGGNTNWWFGEKIQ